MLDVDVTAVVLPVVLVTAIQLVYWVLHSISVRKVEHSPVSGGALRLRC